MAKRKNSYRLTFTIGEQRAQYTAHTQSEAESIRLHVKRLLSAKRTGAPALESEEWAQTRPKGALRDFLIKWGLLNSTDVGMTLADLRDEFMKRQVKERTLLNYKATFDNLIAFFGVGCMLTSIDRKKAGEFNKYLRTSANIRTGEGLNNVTANKRLNLCRQFFGWATNENWIIKNPFAGIKAIGGSANSDTWRYVSKEDTIEVIDSTPNKEHKVIIALMRFCGLRGASELSRLTFDESCLHLSNAGKGAELIVHSTKNERHAGHEQRTIPLTPYVEQLILDLWEAAPEGENRFFPQMEKKSNPGVVVKKAFARFKKKGIDIGLILEPMLN